MNCVSGIAAGLFLVALSGWEQTAVGQTALPPAGDVPSLATAKTVAIAGCCRDELGNPLAGVKIALWKKSRARRGELAREADTGDDGTFRFVDLPTPPPRGASAEWSYVVVATRAGRESQVLSVPPPPSQEELALVMSPSATLVGRVYGPDEKPLKDAVVWSGEADESMTFLGVRSAKTDADGAFSIFDVRAEAGVPAGDSVIVLHPDCAQRRVNFPDDPGRLVIRLREGSTIRGRVVDEVTGQPAAGVVVTAQYEIPSDRVRGFPSSDEVRDVREVLTDGQGEFLFTGMAGESRYRVQAIAGERVPAAAESMITTPGGTDTLSDLKLVRGGLIEGRVLNLKGEPLSHDTQTGDRLAVMISHNSISRVDVGDDGRFVVRVTPGKHRMELQVARIWERTWRRAFFENGIEIADGQTVPVTFRVGDKPQPKARPERADGGKVPLPEPVAEERWAAKEIRELGGWYRLDDDKHVVEVNMVYHEHGGRRYDNGYTESDEALRAVREFSRLETLLLKKGQATDEAMRSIASLKELRRLFVWDAQKLTDEGVRHLASLEKLENVHLSNGQLGDGTLEVLSGLPNLKTMSLQGNAFTDEGLAHLAGMEQLENLWVGLGTPKITDAGLAHLHGLTKLHTLEVQRTGVTDKGIAELKRALPGLQQVFK